MSLRLTPADLARMSPTIQARVAAMLAEEAGAPVTLGGVTAEPAAPVQVAAPTRRVRHPWAVGVAVFAVTTTALVGGSWAWLGRPQAPVPASVGPVSVTAAQPASAVSATPAVQPTPAPATSPAHASVPADVLPNPPQPGATICQTRGGRILGCRWVPYTGVGG